MTVRVSPPGGGYGNPNRWPIVHEVADPDYLCKLLDAVHEHALVAWDRDVRLREGKITVATSDGSGGPDILAYAYVDCVVIWRLTRVPSDPLGVQWIGYGKMTADAADSSVRSPDIHHGVMSFLAEELAAGIRGRLCEVTLYHLSGHHSDAEKIWRWERDLVPELFGNAAKFASTIIEIAESIATARVFGQHRFTVQSRHLNGRRATFSFMAAIRIGDSTQTIPRGQRTLSKKAKARKQAKRKSKR